MHPIVYNQSCFTDQSEMLGVCRQHLYNDAKHLIRQISPAMATRHRGQKTMLCTPWQHGGGRRPEDRATAFHLFTKKTGRKVETKSSERTVIHYKNSMQMNVCILSRHHSDCSGRSDHMLHIQMSLLQYSGVTANNGWMDRTLLAKHDSKICQ